MRVRRSLTAACAAAAVPFLSGCGVHHSNSVDANNIGTYAKAGPVTYQLEISRQLNPYSPEDSGYLVGLPKSEGTLTPDEEWYGVFMWAKNTTHRPQKTTALFDMVDTQGNVYHPIFYNNPYVWTSQMLPPGATEPAPDTTAGFGPTQGGLLLFKVRGSGINSVYDNRPLMLEIRGNSGKVWATISLDL